MAVGGWPRAWGVFVIGWGLLAAAASGQSLTSLDVSGGSSLVFANLTLDPAFALIETHANTPTAVALEKPTSPEVVRLSLSQINDTAAAWQGLEFGLTGGFFSSPPRGTFGGPAGSVRGQAAASASLVQLVGVGVSLSVTFELDMGSGTSGVLTVTPIVPEPTTGGWLLLTTLLLGGRRAG